MKLGVGFTAACMVYFSCWPAAAERLQNEPTGFAGIGWGASYAEFADQLKLVRHDDNVKVYKRNPEQFSIPQTEILKVAYRFYKDRFSAGIVQTYGAENSRALREVLRSKYGESKRLSKRQELDRWDGERMAIILTCSVTSYCAAEFISREIIAQEEHDTGKPIEILKKDKDGDGDAD